MYYLSICAVVRQEGQYLREWLEYHIIQGVEHFFIYNNLSVDDTEDILKEYQSYGLVTYENMPDVPIQPKAYSQCLTHHSKDSYWIAFLDLDEFLVNKKGKFVEALPDFKKYSGLALHWKFFGTNGHLTKTPGLVIERFTRCDSKPGRHVKSVIQPIKALKHVTDPHTYYFKQGYAVDELHRKLPRQYSHSNPNPTTENLWLNHYHVKSKEEFEARKKFPSAATGGFCTNKETHFKGHDLNDMEDLTAAQYAPEVTRMIESRGA